MTAIGGNASFRLAFKGVERDGIKVAGYRDAAKLGYVEIRRRYSLKLNGGDMRPDCDEGEDG